MSNLSELLPAGGAAKEFEPVASGTLPNGTAVVLKSNGQIEVVAETPIAVDIPVGSEVEFEAGTTSYLSVSFNPADKGKFLVTYRDGDDSGYGKAVIGTISGSSLTFATPSTFNAGSTGWIDSEFDPRGNGTFVVAYRDFSQSNYGRSIVGTVSGTTVTYAGSETVFHSNTTSYVSISFDPNTAGSFVIGFNLAAPPFGSRAAPGTVSGSSLTYGTVVTVAAMSEWQKVAFSPQSAGKFVFAYNDNANNKGRVSVCTKSGNSVTEVGNYAEFNSGTTKWIALSFDPVVADRLVMAYQDGATAHCRLATFSGTTFTFGGEAAFNGQTTNVSVAFDPKGGQFVVTYNDGDNSLSGTARVGSVSSANNTITLDSTEYVYNTGRSSFNPIGFDNTSNEGKFVVAYQDATNKGEGILGQAPSTSTNVSSFVGITAEAITSGATGVVVPQGGVAASVANIDIVQLYGSEAVFNSGSTNYVSLSFDPNTANKFVAVYRDVGNSNYGTAIVGTISGNSISFGSEVVFNSGATTYTKVSFDPNNAGKVVVAYGDGSAGSDGMAIVGTVSGTSISFGSEAVFNSGSTGYINIGFDPSSSGKFVVAYQDAGNSNYGTAIVGTVSGTSISYGSEVLFAAADTNVSAISFDANASGKFVIFYTDGGNSNYGTAIVGTLSGTSTSYGSEVVFNSAGSYHLASEFDPNTANKIAFSFVDAGDGDKGTIIIGTVSGTSISFGSKFIFNDNTSYTSMSFDSNTSGRLVVAYRNKDNSHYGTSRVGTVSGTSISFGTVVIFNAGTTDYPALSFDPNTANKYVIAYKDNGNSGYGTAIVGNLSDALTIGSNYYVQSDGKVSTVSTSPAVNIGKAISTTSLILKG